MSPIAGIPVKNPAEHQKCLKAAAALEPEAAKHFARYRALHEAGKEEEAEQARNDFRRVMGCIRRLRMAYL